MQKFIFIFVFSTLLASCSTAPNKAIKLADEKELPVVGIWAMRPLFNGIANVVEFTKEGKSNLYSFNCREKYSNDIESSLYTVSDDGKNIHIDSGGEVQDLSLISINSNTMILGQKVGDDFLEFSYVRTNRVSPLCFLYKESEQDKSKRTAFKETDFTPAPWIPDNSNITRYVGKWAKEGEIQIEVNRDADGRYKIFHENNENWNYLYNNVHWSGVELRFQSFTYSDKPDLFDHPYHKSSSMGILAPVDDINKIRWSFFIGDKRYDYILSRKLP